MVPRRRSVAWWVAKLLAFAVLGGVLLIGALFAFGHLFMPSMDDLGAHPMKPKTAAWAMRDRRIAIPDGFTYREGVEVREFVGANGYYGRYLVPGDFAGAERALAEANPDFPKVRSIPCTAESSGRDFPDMSGFSCDAGTKLAVSARPSRWANPSTGDVSWRSMNTETLVLAVRGAQVELFAMSTGH